MLYKRNTQHTECISLSVGSFMLYLCYSLILHLLFALVLLQRGDLSVPAGFGHPALLLLLLHLLHQTHLTTATLIRVITLYTTYITHEKNSKIVWNSFHSLNLRIIFSCNIFWENNANFWPCDKISLKCQLFWNWYLYIIWKLNT